MKQRFGGFTLIELLVVMAIVSILLTLTLPRYFERIDRAKETVLRDNLRQSREVIQQYYGDTGRYPASLQELVDRRYLTALPFDPVAESDTLWVILPPAPGYMGQVGDLKSGAVGLTLSGIPFGDL